VEFTRLSWFGNELLWQTLNPGDFMMMSVHFTSMSLSGRHLIGSLLSKFLERSELAQPKDEDLKEMAQHF